MGFIGEVVRGHVDEMQIESRQVVWTYVFQCFWAILRSRPMFPHRNRPKLSKGRPPPPWILRKSGLRGTIKGGEQCIILYYIILYIVYYIILYYIISIL